MKVDYLNSADIQYLSLSSREILWRQSWWQRRSFWQCTCCRTTMLKEWPGCFAELLCVRNKFYGGDLVVLSVRFLLGSTYMLAAVSVSNGSRFGPGRFCQAAWQRRTISTIDDFLRKSSLWCHKYWSESSVIGT
jgi:hypothetical protein